MKKELDEKLCRDYPEIFKNRRGNMKETAMCWGFECGDGWYHIIDFLCTGLMNDVRRAKHRVHHIENERKEDQTKWDAWQKGAYGDAALADARKHLTEAEKNIPVAVQVKEKFGGLRFYVSGASDKHHEMISMVESLSYRVCEVCGTMKDVMSYHLGYIRTLCPEHANEQYGSEAEQYRKENNKE